MSSKTVRALLGDIFRGRYVLLIRPQRNAENSESDIQTISITVDSQTLRTASLAFIIRYILKTYLWNSASHFSKLVLINFYDLPGIKSEWFGKLNALFQELIRSWHLKQKRGESASVTKPVKTSTSRVFEGTK